MLMFPSFFVSVQIFRENLEKSPHKRLPSTGAIEQNYVENVFLSLDFFNFSLSGFCWSDIILARAEQYNDLDFMQSNLWDIFWQPDLLYRTWAGPAIKNGTKIFLLKYL